MNNTAKLILSIILMVTIGCSDGTQVVGQIDKLIKVNKIERLVIEIDGQRTEYELPKKGKKTVTIIEGQFIKLNDEYINLSRMKTMKVNNKTLEINL